MVYVGCTVAAAMAGGAVSSHSQAGFALCVSGWASAAGAGKMPRQPTSYQA